MLENIKNALESWFYSILALSWLIWALIGFIMIYQGLTYFGLLGFVLGGIIYALGDVLLKKLTSKFL